MFLGKTIIRRQLLLDSMGFSQGSLPFRYLGAPIFKGAPKGEYFAKVANRIRSKLATWKGALLSMAGRMQLVKSVVQGMMVFTIMIYRWPKEVIRKLQSAINNFIWTGDLQKRGAVTVKWEEICKPFEEFGLGIRDLEEFNTAGMVKLAWEFLKKTNSGVAS